MKAFAIFMIILCLAAFGGVWYLQVTSNVNIFSVSCVVSEPKDNLALFEKLKDQLEQGTFVGTRFTSESLSSAEDYLVYTWTVRIDNRTSLTARIAEIQVSPMKGYDIVQFDPETLLYGTVPKHVVQPNSSIEFTVSVLTSRSILNSQSRADMRDADLTWYLGGFPFPETNGKGGKLVLRP